MPLKKKTSKKNAYTLLPHIIQKNWRNSGAELPVLPREAWQMIFDSLFDRKRGSFETAYVIPRVCKLFASLLKSTKNVFLHLEDTDEDATDFFMDERFGMKHLTEVWKGVNPQSIRGLTFSHDRALDPEIKRVFSGIIFPIASNLEALTLPDGINVDSIVPLLLSARPSLKKLTVGSLTGSSEAKAILAELVSEMKDIEELEVDRARYPLFYGKHGAKEMQLGFQGDVQVNSSLRGATLKIYQTPLFPWSNIRSLKMWNISSKSGICRQFVIPASVETLSIKNCAGVRHIVFARAENVGTLELVDLPTLSAVGALNKSDGLTQCVENMKPTAYHEYADVKMQLKEDDRVKFYEVSTEIIDNWKKTGAPREEQDRAYYSSEVFARHSFRDPEHNPEVRKQRVYYTLSNEGGRCDFAMKGIKCLDEDLEHFKTTRVTLEKLPKLRYLSGLAGFCMSRKIRSITMRTMQNAEMREFVKSLPRMLGGRTSDESICPDLERIYLKDVVDLNKTCMVDFWRAVKFLSPADQRKIIIE